MTNPTNQASGDPHALPGVYHGHAEDGKAYRIVAEDELVALKNAAALATQPAANAEVVAHVNLTLWRTCEMEAQDCFSDKPFEGSVPVYLAHPAQAPAAPSVGEPVAWMMKWPNHLPSFTTDKSDYVTWLHGRSSYPDELIPLYATPPAAPAATEAQSDETHLFWYRKGDQFCSHPAGKRPMFKGWERVYTEAQARALANPAPAVPGGLTAETLYDGIKEALEHYRLSSMVGEDGEPYPLVDALSTPGMSTSTGKDEIMLVCDAIYNEVLRPALAAASTASQPPGAAIPKESGDV